MLHDLDHIPGHRVIRDSIADTPHHDTSIMTSVVERARCRGQHSIVGWSAQSALVRIVYPALYVTPLL